MNLLKEHFILGYLVPKLLIKKFLISESRIFFSIQKSLPGIDIYDKPLKFASSVLIFHLDKLDFKGMHSKLDFSVVVLHLLDH